MNSIKATCNFCGVEILESTYSSTGGFCIPCKQKVDIEKDYKTKINFKNEKFEGFKFRHGWKFRLIFMFLLQLFMIFSFLYQIHDNYPKINIPSDTQVLSKLMVVISSLGVLLFTGTTIFYAFKIIKNDKNT